MTQMVKRALLGAALLFAAVGVVRAESLDWKVGTIGVKVTAVSEGVFRISVREQGEEDKRIASVFLDPLAKEGDVGKRMPSDAGDRRDRLVTKMGALQVDRRTGQWGLVDAKGNVLVPMAVIAAEGKDFLEVRVGWPAGKDFAVYGCGNGAATLVQHEVKSQVGNGVGVEPFFWAPGGFATFVVGGDDNRPASCDGKVNDGAATWRVPGTKADVYVLIAPRLGDASRALLGLTGKPPVPPEWTLGYLQSRWGWKDRAYISDALKEFEKRRLPVDAFIFDFEWYTSMADYQVKPEGVKGFSDFGWNSAVFPDPAAQLKELHDAGVKFVGIRKPRLGNMDALADMARRGWRFEEATTGIYARALSFANPDARQWYATQIEPLLRDGVDGWWDDEGECTYTNYIYWNEAQRTALDAVRPGARLWTLNRAFQPGLARLGAAAWTGDIHATWEDLQKTPNDLLNWSVAGMPFVGCDIGGFRGDVTPELLVRWMEAGVFFPVMRAHSDNAVTPHFPWLFGKEAEDAIRHALDLRYRLVPCFYSLAHEVHQTGVPWMRPLLLEYPDDPRVANLSSEWMVGRELLVAPVLEKGGTREVYLPDDTWYEFFSGKRIDGGTRKVSVALEGIPLYVRGGSILPLGPVVEHTRDLPGGPLEVNVYPGKDAAFTLVEDDGMTDGYLHGKVRTTTFLWNEEKREFSWKRSGDYDGKNCFTEMQIVVHDGKARPAVDRKTAGDGRVSFRE